MLIGLNNRDVLVSFKMFAFKTDIVLYVYTNGWINSLTVPYGLCDVIFY